MLKDKCLLANFHTNYLGKCVYVYASEKRFEIQWIVTEVNNIEAWRKSDFRKQRP